MKISAWVIAVGLCLNSSLGFAGDVISFSDSFDEATSQDQRPDWRAQEQMGTVVQINGPIAGHTGVLKASAGAKDTKVGKAGLIAPFDSLRSGSGVRVAADFYFPKDTPRNSIILMDLECKYCGVQGNPGIRLYLRDGQIRIDRKKIGKRHAWTGHTEYVVPADTWIRIEWDVTLGLEAKQGLVVVRVDGNETLRQSGRTLPALNHDTAAIDRLQIGITANSNPVSAVVFVDNLTFELWP